MNIEELKESFRTEINSKFEENNRTLLKMLLELLPTKAEILSQAEFDGFKTDIKLIRETVLNLSRRIDSFELPIISKNIENIQTKLNNLDIRISKLENIVEGELRI